VIRRCAAIVRKSATVKNNVAAFSRRDIVFMGFDSTRKLLTISPAFNYLFPTFGMNFHIVEILEAHYAGAALKP
jgi:hypothetical protein